MAGTASGSTPTNDIRIVTSDIIAPDPQSQPLSGILIVYLYEGAGFSLPDQYQQQSNNHQLNSLMQDTEFGVSGSVHSSSSQQAGNISNPYTGSTHPQTSGARFRAIPINRRRHSSKYRLYALLDFDKSQVVVESVSGTLENTSWAGDCTPYKFDVSRVAEFAVHLYLRNLHAKPGSGRSQDICLGVARISPRFEESHKSVEAPNMSKEDTQKAAAEFNQKEKTLNLSSAEWVEVQYNTGKIRIEVDYIENKTPLLKVQDFEYLRFIGKSGFAKVLKVSKKDTKQIYAMKSIPKAYTIAKQPLLTQINNPFIVPLKFAFQSPHTLYFASPFVHGSELFHHLQHGQHFDVDRSRLYTAELLCALECLHGSDVIYRDLKPENIHLDYSGHITLCDFGLYKLEDTKDEDSTSAFRGTSAYQAPELLLGQDYTETADWWTLGVLLYEMLIGSPPFHNENNDEINRDMLPESLQFPDPDIVPQSAKDILTKLLKSKPEQRLGVNGAFEIKAHPFFHGIDWRKLLQGEYEPTFKPNHGQIVFETMEDVPLSQPALPQLSQEELAEMQEQFRGWSFR